MRLDPSMVKLMALDRTSPWETATFVVCRKVDGASHTAIATDEPEEVITFLWGTNISMYKLLIRGREYTIHPNLDKMRKLIPYYLDIDSMYDTHEPPVI